MKKENQPRNPFLEELLGGSAVRPQANQQPTQPETNPFLDNLPALPPVKAETPVSTWQGQGHRQLSPQPQTPSQPTQPVKPPVATSAVEGIKRALGKHRPLFVQQQPLDAISGAAPQVPRKQLDFGAPQVEPTDMYPFIAQPDSGLRVEQPLDPQPTHADLMRRMRESGMMPVPTHTQLRPEDLEAQRQAEAQASWERLTPEQKLVYRILAENQQERDERIENMSPVMRGIRGFGRGVDSIRKGAMKALGSDIIDNKFFEANLKEIAAMPDGPDKERRIELLKVAYKDILDHPENIGENILQGLGSVIPYAFVGGPVSEGVGLIARGALQHTAPRLAKTAIGKILPDVAGRAAVGGTVAGIREGVKLAVDPMEWEPEEAIKNIATDSARFAIYYLTSQVIGEPIRTAIKKGLSESVAIGQIAPNLSSLLAGLGGGASTGATIAALSMAANYMRDPDNFDMNAQLTDAGKTTLFWTGMEMFFTLGKLGGSDWSRQIQANTTSGSLRILGLKKGASMQDIKKAHRTLVRKSHPDLNPNDPSAEARFRTYQAAYEHLVKAYAGMPTAAPQHPAAWQTAPETPTTRGGFITAPGTGAVAPITQPPTTPPPIDMAGVAAAATQLPHQAPFVTPPPILEQSPVMGQPPNVIHHLSGAEPAQIPTQDPRATISIPPAQGEITGEQGAHLPTETQPQVKAPASLKELQEQFVGVSPENIGQEKAEALGVLVKGVAAYKGIDPDEYVRQRFRGVVGGGTPADDALFRRMEIDDKIQAATPADKDFQEPQKTIKAYKLFRTLKNQPGKIFPLFIGKTKPTAMGEWIPAEHLPTKGYAERPGWHAGALPYAPHLMKKDGTMQEGRVWAEVEVPADTDWQAIANTTKTQDIRDRVPEGGHYRFSTSKQQGGSWIIGGAIKVNRTLSPEEVKAIITESAPDLLYRMADGKPLASVEFDEDAKALIRAFSAPDVATMVHELGHIFRRDLSRQDLAIIEKWAGVVDGAWTAEAEEKFADGMVEYLAEGNEPSDPKLKKVFENFKQWLTEIFKSIGQKFRVALSEPVRSVYNRLLTGKKPEPDSVEASAISKIVGSDKLARQIVDAVKQGGIAGWKTEENIFKERSIKQIIHKYVEDDASLHKVFEVLKGAPALEGPKTKASPAEQPQATQKPKSPADMSTDEYLAAITVEGTPLVVRPVLHNPRNPNYNEWVLLNQDSNAVMFIPGKPKMTWDEAVSAAKAENFRMEEAALRQAEMAAKRQAEKASATTQEKSAERLKVTDAGGFTVEKTKHTKTGQTLWVVRMPERLDSESFKKVQAKVTQLGGSRHSNFTKGFNFYEDPTDLLPQIAAVLPKPSPEAPGVPTSGAKEDVSVTLQKLWNAAGGESQGEKRSKFMAAVSKTDIPIKTAQAWIKENVIFWQHTENVLSQQAVKFENRTGKKPWQATKEEFVGVGIVTASGNAHAQHVEGAVEAGEAVPREVLEQYKNNDWAQTALDKMGKTVAKQEEKRDTETKDTARKVVVVSDEQEVPAGGKRGSGGDQPLEGAPAKDVQGAQGGGEVGGGGVRGAGGDKRRIIAADKQGDELSHGLGDREGGLDIPPGRTDAAEPRDKPAGVGSAGKPRGITGQNYRITEAEGIEERSAKVKTKDNIESIRLMKQLLAEGRPATPAEQEALVKYVGWGFNKQIFDPPKVKDDGDNASRAELKELLTKEEWTAARASSQFAHYTATPVIRAMYGALDRLGFTGGRTLEPAMGVGHFFGMMPEAMMSRSWITGVEIESLTGNIAALLYPRGNINIMGYQDFAVPYDKSKLLQEDYYDLVIGNVPFSESRPFTDPRYDHIKGAGNLHNYFFVKAIDQVRPGGFLAFITSRYTLDARDKSAQDFRRHMADKADFIGAVRLHNETFKGIAATRVVADIIILQKREPGAPMKGEKWIETSRVLDLPGLEHENYAPNINEYFLKYPENVLGEPAILSHGMYTGQEYTVKPTEDTIDIQKALEGAFSKLPTDIYKPPEKHKATEAATVEDMLPAEPSTFPGSFTIKDGKLMFTKVTDRGELAIVSAAKELNMAVGGLPEKRAMGMVGLRDALLNLAKLEMTSTDEMDVNAARKKLNTVYDAFVKKHGPVSSASNSRAFGLDPSYYRIAALENVNPKTGAVKKADVFSKRTVQLYKPATKADTSQEALTITLNERGHVDFEHMTNLTGKAPEDLQQELLGLVYHDPEVGWVTDDEYLSGNVREKLRIAEDAAKHDPSFEPNVTALKDVQPTELKPEEIYVALGAPWIPAKDVRDFLGHILDLWRNHIVLTHNPLTGQWVIGFELTSAEDAARRSANNRSKWGIPEMDALKIIEKTLNNETVEVAYTVDTPDGRKKRVVDQAKTIAAKAKQEEIQAEYEKWLWGDPSRQQRLVHKYNHEYNNTRLREFNGDHLTFPGMNPAITLESHQKRAVWRAIQGRSTLLAHAVGAGKTFEMAAAAMEMKRLGIIKKPALVSPNHLVVQTAKQAQLLYPAANIMFFSPKDMDKNSRKKTTARIATGDWDLVIIPESSFGKLPMPVEYVENFIDKELAKIDTAIAMMGDMGKTVTRKIVKARDALESKLRKQLDRLAKDQDAGFMTLPETGFDALIVDESHSYKNLFYSTKMSRVGGLGTQEGSLRAFDMLMKTDYIRSLRDGSGIIFASGTPISNTMAELYHLQRYLDPAALEACRIHSFDAWAQTFGQVVTAVELNPSGKGFRQKQRFARFVNAAELLHMYRSFADIVNHEMLVEILGDSAKMPKMVGNERILKMAEPSPEMLEYMDALQERADAIAAGRVTPNEDNYLKIVSDGRLVALYPPLRGLPDYQGSKIDVAVENVFDIWKSTRKDKMTQILFIDLSTPKGKSAAAQKAEDAGETTQYAEEEWNEVKGTVYNVIRQRLLAKGVTKNEIAFIHDYKTDPQRIQLFDDMNAGNVRILLGSTSKMGVGMNVQERLLALHHVDAPWRPSDIGQREGRIIRRGNINEEVYVYSYGTESTLDAFIWQKLESKQRFITQSEKGDLSVRSMDDVDEMSFSFAQIKAGLSGNPLIMEHVELQNELTKLLTLEKSHKGDSIQARSSARRYEIELEQTHDRIIDFKKDLTMRQDTKADNFKIELAGKTYDKRPEAKEALEAIYKNMLEVLDNVSPASRDKAIAKLEKNGFVIDTSSGMDIRIGSFAGGSLWLNHGSWRWSAYVQFNKRHMSEVSLQSIEHAVNNIEGVISYEERRLEDIQQTLAGYRDRLKDIGDFPHAARLKETKDRIAAIEKELDLDKADHVVMSDDDDSVTGDEEMAFMSIPRVPWRTKKAPSAAKVAEQKPKTQEAAAQMREERKSAAEQKQGEVTKTAILKAIRTHFRVAMRLNRFYGKTKAAIYKPKHGTMRVRSNYARSLRHVTHELGHHLDKLYDLADNRFAVELLSIPYVQTLMEVNPKTPKKTLLKEGVAEFINMYLMDPAMAAKWAPEFMENLEAKLTSMPDVQDKLLDVRQMIDVYTRQSDVEAHLDEFIGGEGPSHGKNVTARAKEQTATWWERFSPSKLYTALVDRQHPIIEAAEKIVGGRDKEVFQELWDTFRTSNSDGRAEAFIEHGQYVEVLDKKGNPTGAIEKTGPGLVEIWGEIASLGENRTASQEHIDRFNKYIVAKHAIEMEQNGLVSGALDADRGIDIDHLEAFVRDVEKSKYGSVYAKQLDEVVNYRNFVFDLLVAKDEHSPGHYSEADKARIIGKWRYPIPFKRILPDERSKGRGASSTSPIKRLKGADLPIVPPLQSLLRETMLFNKLALENEAALAFFDLLETHPMEAGKFMDEVPLPKQMTKTTLHEILGNITSKGLEPDFDIEGMESLVIELYRPLTVNQPGKHIAIFWRGGEPKSFEIYDKDLFGAITKLNMEQSIVAGRVGRALAAPFRLGHIVNTAFPWRNMHRDTPIAAAHSERGFIPYATFFDGILSIIAGPLKKAFEGFTKKIDMDDNAFVARFLGDQEEYKTVWMYYGGTMKSPDVFNEQAAEKMLDKVMRRNMSKVIMGWINPMTYLRAVANASEMGTNIGETKRGLHQGIAPKRAVAAGRDLTVDHDVFGSKTRFLRDVIPFFNPFFQGHAKMYRQLKNPKTRWSTLFKYFLFITLPTIANYLLVRENEYYQEINPLMKDGFMHIPLGNPKETPFFLPIPRAHSIPGFVFGAMIERALRFVDTNDGEAFKDWQRTFGSTLTPNLTVWPIELAYELQTNFNIFGGFPIENMSDLNRPKAERYGPHTSETAKAVGSIFNISPKKIDFSIGKATGILGRTAVAGTDALLVLARLTDGTIKAREDIADRPIIGDYVFRLRASGSTSVDRFYSDLAKAMEINTSEQGARTRIEQAYVAALPELRRVQREITVLRATERAVHKATTWKDLAEYVNPAGRMNVVITAEEKRQMLDYLQLEQVNIARIAYGKKPIPH